MKKRIIYIIFGLIGIGVGMGTLPPLWDLIGWADNHFLNDLLIDGLIGGVVFLLLASLSVGWILRSVESVGEDTEHKVAKLLVVRQLIHDYRLDLGGDYFNSVLWLRCTAEYLPTTHHHAIIRLLGFSGGYDTQRRMAAAFEFP